MKFRNDLLKVGSGLFIGYSLFQFIFEGSLPMNALISNAIGGLIGGAIYAWWVNRKTRHEIFRKKR